MNPGHGSGIVPVRMTVYLTMAEHIDDRASAVDQIWSLLEFHGLFPDVSSSEVMAEDDVEPGSPLALKLKEMRDAAE